MRRFFPVAVALIAITLLAWIWRGRVPAAAIDPSTLKSAESSASSAQHTTMDFVDGVPSTTRDDNTAFVEPRSRTAIDSSDARVTIFGRVSCAAQAGFDPTLGHLSVLPPRGNSIDVQPDAAGNFEVKDLWLGSCRIQYRCDNCWPFRREIELTAGQDHVRVDVALRTARRIEVLIEDAHGLPFPAGSLHGSGSSLNNALSLEVTRTMPTLGQELGDRGGSPDVLDELATLEQSSSPRLWHEVLIAPATDLVINVLFEGIVLDAKPIEPNRDEVTLVVDSALFPGFVHATVIDDVTALPIEGATMTIERSHPTSSSRLSTVRSDEHGELRDRLVFAGGAHICVAAPGHVALELHTEFEAGVVHELGVLRLSPGVSVSGHVSRSDGRGVVLPALACWPATADSEGLRAIRTTWTDIDGSFRFEDLPLDTYVIGEFSDEESAAIDARIPLRANDVYIRRALVGPRSRALARIDATRGNVKDVKITLAESLNSPSDIRR